jgi:pimeloyl-ACP methyl ester carboxylesterase
VSTFSTSEVTIGYDDHGAGDTLVLVHGHPFNRSMWRPQLERFSRAGWRVVAPDLRGYGQTTVVPGTTSFASFAGDVVALLDHLELDQVVLGGLSMGGQIVMEVHRLFPERVRGLVLADTSPQAETPQGREERNAMADRLLGEGMGPYAREVLAKMVAPHNIAALPAVADHVMAMMLATSPDGAAAALRGRAERPDYVDMLSQVAVPALVVVGADDELTPISDAELMADRIPDATLAVVDGAAHMPNLERPDEFDAALGSFLHRLGGA